MVIPTDILNPDIAANVPLGRVHIPKVSFQSPPLPPAAGSDEHLTASESESDSEDEWRSRRDEDASSQESQESSDLETLGSGSESSESSMSTHDSSEWGLKVTVPRDGEGNNLVTEVDTAPVQTLDGDAGITTNITSKHDTETRVGETKTFSIGKADLAQRDGQTLLRLHYLPGPITNRVHSDECLRWIHLRSARLSLDAFQSTCLSIPKLSKRLQELVRHVFVNVEKERLKISLNGAYIEPGTVRRVDEKNKPDPNSVIFSCIPYFELQTPETISSAVGHSRGASPQTLMQSYYPYEPVQERDAEQAYRKFNSERNQTLVHVPNLWIMKIGPEIVVTCGHGTLEDVFGPSIKLVAIECGPTAAGRPKRDIRLTDWSGRKLVYTSDECRSYFQMEQRLRELQESHNRSSRSRDERSLELFWTNKDDQLKVSSHSWGHILRQSDTFFTDVTVSKVAGDKEGDHAEFPPTDVLSTPTEPFFAWPHKMDSEGKLSSNNTKAVAFCIDFVEKAILSQTLRPYPGRDEIEKTFTSTEYYRHLTQSTTEQVQPIVDKLQHNGRAADNLRVTQPRSHQILLRQYRGTIRRSIAELVDCSQKITRLFMADINGSVALRKLWAAMQTICEVSGRFLDRKSPIDDTVHPDPSNPPKIRGEWVVRPYFGDGFAPETLKKLKQSFKRCSKCRETDVFVTQQAALRHIQKHLKQADVPESFDPTSQGWIIHTEQMRLELWTEGCATILTTAQRIAKQLHTQAMDLSYGVLNEDGAMSSLYILPRSLLEAFRQLLIFCFAVERAVSRTEKTFDDDTCGLVYPRHMNGVPFSTHGLQVIEAFGSGVQHMLATARSELCEMARSTESSEATKHLSLNSEYICGWLMRRVIVKPLEKGLTVSDMYREYLSTIVSELLHAHGFY